MTQEQILQKAMWKAHLKGWHSEWTKTEFEVAMPYWKQMIATNSYFGYIYDHGFAKAFFGEEFVDCDCSHECTCKCYMCTNGWNNTPKAQLQEYQIQLQKLVISEDPIGYLENFL